MHAPHSANEPDALQPAGLPERDRTSTTNQPAQTALIKSGFPNGETVVSGQLHIYVAFDWGEEINLELAQKLLPAELQSLARRRRTPASIGYRPAPLRYTLAGVPIELPEIGRVSGAASSTTSTYIGGRSNATMPPLSALGVIAEATVFDFGGVSVALHVPFQLTGKQLLEVASFLSEPNPLINSARAAVSSLHAAILPAINEPRWIELTEEYFVFQIPPTEAIPSPGEILHNHAGWLAALARLESDLLSSEEIEQAIQSHISYSPSDLFLPEWSAALLVDRHCEETLQVIEFANLQLLEYRFLDTLLDDRLAEAHKIIAPMTRSWLPFWRLHDRRLRSLGELKIDANNVFERTGNALKLMGDQYLARVYQMLSARFHLPEWERSIERSLETVESVYKVVSDQSAHYRTEFLEMIVIFLIAFEIIMAFVGH